MNPNRPIVLWRFLDGRSGHENQVIGLYESIAALHPCVFVDIASGMFPRGWRTVFADSWAFAVDYPRPDLLIGAGHSTHVPMLMCRRVFGGRTVVIMKPSLPPALFDLCLVPRHDTLRFPWPGVIRTAGAINRVRPSESRDPRRGLILVGGPSKHFHWSDQDVLRGIQKVTDQSPQRWQIVTSRRTPPSFLKLWTHTGVDIPHVDQRDAPSEWFGRTLAESGTVWVTCDSVSMIYEALTSGARTGLLPLRPRSGSRIAQEVQRLICDRLVLSADHRHTELQPAFQAAGCTEADRCAAAILERGLVSVRTSSDLQWTQSSPGHRSVAEERDVWQGGILTRGHCAVGLGLESAVFKTH
ncbi:MAG: ELM1/GtrOC1 family putative glycosyltransferase [Planctomycetia bacterium]